jgi:hypothetical protein
VTPEELVRRTGPVIGDLGWQFYFTTETVARGARHGLDAVEFYVVGRGGVLGDVEWQVVASAFGYFNPAAVETLWRKASALLSPREAGREYLAACHDFGRLHFADLDGLDEFCAAAEEVHAAAGAAACPLYAGLGAEPLAEDLPARAMQLVTTLREHRGGVHLIAVVAAGLRPLVAHYLRRPEMMEMFGWQGDDIPITTNDDVEKLMDADRLTDLLVLPAYAVLDTAERAAFAEGLERMQEAVPA